MYIAILVLQRVVYSECRCLSGIQEYHLMDLPVRGGGGEMVCSLDCLGVGIMIAIVLSYMGSI